LEYLRATATANDELVAAPSGAGYSYLEALARAGSPSTRVDLIAAQAMPQDGLKNFAAATAELVEEHLGPDATVNIIGYPGADAPDVEVLETFAKAYGDAPPLVWYTYADGYAGYSNYSWLSDGAPVLGAPVSLWGDALNTTMRGVDGVVDYFLNDSALVTDPADPAAYTIVPVNIWGHNVTDACAVAKRL